MSEKAQWYYVENNDRKGPVVLAELKQLATRGVVTPETLVWKEGMPDWEKAQSIKGLFQQEAKARPKINVGDSASSAPNKSQPTAQPTVKPNAPGPVSIETGGSPGKSTGQLAPSVAPTISVQTDNNRTHPLGAGINNFFHQFKFIGYPCLVIGFMLVITGKGCDSLGQRWAARLNANSRIAETKFDAKYDKQRNSLQAQIDSINESDNPNTDRITDLNKRISDLTKAQNKERNRLMKTTWYDLKSSARMADSNNRAWGFYREMIFVFGSMVLSIGLLVVGLTGDGSEKWICLIMLAIITFSIYVGGFAWVSSIQGNLPI